MHLAAELVTAGVLAAGGALLIAGESTGLALAGLGMPLYTVIASPGYFVARRVRCSLSQFAGAFNRYSSPRRR